MAKRAFGVLFLVLQVVSCGASATPTGNCETTSGLKTDYGVLSRTECGNATVPRKNTISLNGSALLSSRELFNQDFDRKRGLFLFSPEAQQESGCSDRIYLVDVSLVPARVFGFGVKNACNEFHWASWGDKRSVIALKKNVKFVYENGKIVVPKGGKSLWNSIEPPHAGAGISEEDAVPFAEEVSLPK